ncbi:hypothetical protein [Rhizobium sp. BK661]|uniref:hypothetical protein n=1 Tax=Rhizobium sp. BK661 TaxID=2586991 RepID=UPI002168421D|nr:hypothetical protein [Rhizobium sp. BK661]MCS3739329.1 hypothetical protein [Rhizobium sp. BK661]
MGYKYKTPEEAKAAKAAQARAYSLKTRGPRKTVDRRGMTEAEREAHDLQVYQRWATKQAEAAGRTYEPRRKFTDEEREEGRRLAVQRYTQRRRIEMGVAERIELRLKIRQEREATKAARRAERAERHKLSAKERWKLYFANETPEQRERRLYLKAVYRETEVNPKVREIVEHILYDFSKAQSNATKAEVAEEWYGVSLSCWLTEKALWYADVHRLMEKHLTTEDGGSL